MDVTEAQAVNNLLRWLLRLARPDGGAVTDERFCEAALYLARLARGPLPDGVGPEQIALPLGHLVDSRQLAVPSIAADVPIPGVISPRGLLDGAATLTEAAQRVTEFANWLRGLAAVGYELEGPISEDCGVYGTRGPALGRSDSGNMPGSV
jgi:hypothetical protein